MSRIAESRPTRFLALPALGVGILLSVLYLYFFALKAHVELEIRMFEPVHAWFKIYWADAGADYNESNMQQVLIDGNHEKYDLFIGNLARIDRIRIDPVEFRTKLFIKRIGISQPGFAPIELNPQNAFMGLEPVQQIDRLVAKEDGLRFNTTGRDAQFEYRTDPGGGSIPFIHLFTILGILAGSLLAGRALSGLGREERFVPPLLLVALCLALIMAVISKHYWLHPNGTARIFVHPDEEVHSAAVHYYRNHWLPPAIDNPEILESFSVYGYSRLASYELYYPVAGYLTRLLAPLHQPFMWDARMAGLLFLVLMVVLSWRYVSFRPFAVPLLVTPQVWYVYSYANSDGFALLLSTLAAWQVAHRDSALNRLLREPDRPHWATCLWLGLLAGSLLLLKLNFYFFILFMGAYLLWRIATGDFPDQRRFWTRVSIVVLIALALYGMRWGLEVNANGWDSRDRIAVMIEERAEPLYKPSTELHSKHIYLNMRERGHSLKQILQKEQWGGKSFVSAFGAYGYTQYVGTSIYYSLVKWIGIGLLLVMLVSLLIHGPPRIWFLFALTLGSASLLVAASLYQSWTISFQAQGRYLAPILPMFGILYYHARPWLLQRTFNVLLFSLFGLAVWSFLFIGLAMIPKLP